MKILSTDYEDFEHGLWRFWARTMKILSTDYEDFEHGLWRFWARTLKVLSTDYEDFEHGLWRFWARTMKILVRTMETMIYDRQGWTNSRRQIAWASKFWTVAPNIFGSSRNLLHVSLLAPRILRWLLKFWKFVHPFYMVKNTQFEECQYISSSTVHLFHLS